MEVTMTEEENRTSCGDAVWGWNLNVGDLVEELPHGRLGLLVDWEASRMERLPCGCCSEPGVPDVLVKWADDGSEDWLPAEDVRKLERN